MRPMILAGMVAAFIMSNLISFQLGRGAELMATNQMLKEMIASHDAP